MVFVFSCIVSSVYASTVAVSSIETTLSGSRLVMLARMLLALVLAVVAVGTEGDRLNFGKLYSVVMVASVALVACLPLVTVLHTVLAQVVSLSSVVFELFLWCILAFIVFQRRTSAVVVFGYGYGAYQLGNGIGWLFGAQLLGDAVRRRRRGLRLYDYGAHRARLRFPHLLGALSSTGSSRRGRRAPLRLTRC